MKKPRPIEVERLVRTKRLSEFSPIVLLSQRLGLKWLTYWGEYVYGPTPGIIELLDALILKLKPKSFLDLFAGSGSLSRLASLRKIKEITAVEIHPETLRLNLREENRVKIIEEDVFKFRPDKNYDLIAADPPEELVHKVLTRMDELRNWANQAILIWLGPYHLAGETIRVVKRFRKRMVLESWGDCFAVFWKPGYEEKIREAVSMVEAI